MFIEARGIFRCAVWASPSLVVACRVFFFSLSLVEARGLSCPVVCGILVPRPGIEPMSPALEGRFFTTGPPGKSLNASHF